MTQAHHKGVEPWLCGAQFTCALQYGPIAGPNAYGASHSHPGIYISVISPHCSVQVNCAPQVHHTSKVQHLGGVPGLYGYLVRGEGPATWLLVVFSCKSSPKLLLAPHHADRPVPPKLGPQTTLLHLISDEPCLCVNWVDLEPCSLTIWGLSWFFPCPGFSPKPAWSLRGCWQERLAAAQRCALRPSQEELPAAPRQARGGNRPARCGSRASP